MSFNFCMHKLTFIPVHFMLMTFIGNLFRVQRNMLLCTPSLLDVSDCSLEMNSECTEMFHYGH
jgi:hypothetical protein